MKCNNSAFTHNYDVKLFIGTYSQVHYSQLHDYSLIHDYYYVIL